MRKDARTVRRDMLAPLARFQFGPDVPVPHFERKPERLRDLEQLTRVLDAAVNKLGVRVPAAWAHETLGIPRAAEEETVL